MKIMQRIFLTSLVLFTGAQLFAAAQNELNAAQTIRGLQRLKTVVTNSTGTVSSLSAHLQAQQDFDKKIDNALSLFGSGNLQAGRAALKNIRYNRDIPEFENHQLLKAYPEKYSNKYVNYVLDQLSEGKDPYSRPL